MFMFFLKKESMSSNLSELDLLGSLQVDLPNLLYLLVFFFSMKIFISVKFLLMLVSMEILSLTLLFLFFIDHQSGAFLTLCMIVILTFLAVESVLGLCLFIQYTRISGKNSMRSLKKIQKKWL